MFWYHIFLKNHMATTSIPYKRFWNCGGFPSTFFNKLRKLNFTWKSKLIIPYNFSKFGNCSNLKKIMNSEWFCCSTIVAIYSNLYVVPSIAMVLLLIYYEPHLLLYITLLLLPPLVNYWTPSASTFACALLLQLYCYCYWCYFILLLLPPLTTHQFFKATKLWRNKQQKFLTIYYCFHLSPLTNVFKQPHLHTILTRLNLVHSTKYRHNAHKLMLKISCSLCLSIFNGPTHFLAFNS